MPSSICHVERAIGAVAGIKPGAAMQIGRVMKEAPDPQWPGPGSGRRSIDLTPQHVAAFLLGTLAEGPANAAEWTRTMGQLHLAAVQRVIFTEGGDTSSEFLTSAHLGSEPKLVGWVFAPTLLGTISALIEKGDSPKPLALLRRVDLDLNKQHPIATLRLSTSTHSYTIRYRPAQESLLPLPPKQQFVTRVVTLWPPLFTELAGIWKSSLPDTAAAPIAGNKPPSANEKAAETAIPMASIRGRRTNGRVKTGGPQSSKSPDPSSTSRDGAALHAQKAAYKRSGSDPRAA